MEMFHVAQGVSPAVEALFQFRDASWYDTAGAAEPVVGGQQASCLQVFAKLVEIAGYIVSVAVQDM